MSKPPAPVDGALTPEEAERLPGLVAEVLNDRDPKARLRRELGQLESHNRPALGAALFERVAYRVDTYDQWIYYHVCRIYTALGPARQDAAFFAAALTMQMGASWPPAGHAVLSMFDTLSRTGRFAEAADLFRHRLTVMPEHPLIGPLMIQPVLARLGQSLPSDGRPACAAGDRRDHPVFPADLRPAWSCTTLEGEMPSGLVPLAAGRWERPAISVAELPDAEVLILQDTVIVLDRSGVLHPDLSVAEYPQEILQKFERIRAEGTSIPLHTADDVAVISDYCPPPNLCHFLLDQFSRLDLYQRVGVDTGRALVIAADPTVAFRQAALRRAGVTNVLGTNRMARVQARRLWVSSNCRRVCHFPHWGAAWAIDFVRRTFGQGERGWRRLYVSRGDAGRRSVVNEAEIARVLEPHGFEMIVPGQMPYEEQVAAFKQASHVIAPHGAALAHLVLCPPEARILEIFHPLFTEPAFAMQIQAAGIDYVAMVARDAWSDAPEWNEPTPGQAMTAYIGRDMRVDLDRLSGYLATLI